MKKLILLFVCSLVFTACELEDDGPMILMRPAEVTGTDLPASFESGKTYTIKVHYLLPDACHLPAGLHVKRGAEFGNGRRDIFISGVASYQAGVQCNDESDDLEKQDSFRLSIDENQPYTFYLWTGVDEENKNIFTEVVVPVGAPGEEGES